MSWKSVKHPWKSIPKLDQEPSSSWGLFQEFFLGASGVFFADFMLPTSFQPGTWWCKERGEYAQHIFFKSLTLFSLPTLISIGAPAAAQYTCSVMAELLVCLTHRLFASWWVGRSTSVGSALKARTLISSSFSTNLLGRTNFKMSAGRIKGNRIRGSNSSCRCPGISHNNRKSKTSEIFTPSEWYIDRRKSGDTCAIQVFGSANAVNTARDPVVP